MEDQDTTQASHDSTGTAFEGVLADFNTRQPWICPRCGRVNAPHIDQCSCTPPVRINPLPVFPTPYPCQPYCPPYTPYSPNVWPWSPTTIFMRG